jgi:hypothetical protein
MFSKIKNSYWGSIFFLLLFSCTLLCLAAYWHLIYLPSVIPSIPLPPDSIRIDYGDWTTSEVYWYKATFRVSLAPAEVERFYLSVGAECGDYYRAFVAQADFYKNCYGNATPIGWYHLEIATDSQSAFPSTIIVAEVGWEAGL